MWLRGAVRLISTSFNAKNLKVTLTTTPKEKPELNEKLLFGTALSDHILEIDWNEKEGWKTPEINPYHPFIIDPASSVFHYGTECFEGMKAYKNSKDNILMFRPELNMKRLSKSAAAVGLPSFDEKEFLELIKELVKIEESWIPNKVGFSLYIRPTMIANHIGLGVAKPKSAKLYTVASTVGPYFPGGFKAITLYSDDEIIRAFPGGTGDKKVGANYGPAIGHTARLQNKGFDQILWLCNSYVTEAGTMNFFVFWKNELGEKELITCELDSTILPGVTRDSILKLSKQWGEFKVTETKFTIYQLIQAIEEGRVIEAFGAGTACIVCPVKNITFKDRSYPIPLALGNSGMLTSRLQEEILKIQYGEIVHEFQTIVK
jgi:branched-chain amino acid aminotransferase